MRPGQRAKEYLTSVKNLELKIEFLRYEIDELEDNISYLPSSSDFGKAKVTNNNISSAVEDVIVRKSEKETDLEKCIAKLAFIRDEAIRMINGLPVLKDQQVLFYRYIKDMTMPEIALTMNYTLRWTQKLHRRALIAFEERYYGG